jgi:hypothetical protein
MKLTLKNITTNWFHKILKLVRIKLQYEYYFYILTLETFPK